MGRNRSFRGSVDQTKYKLTLQQLRDAQDEPLGEAITEALIQGLQRVVENEGFNVQDYSLFASRCPFKLIHSFLLLRGLVRVRLPVLAIEFTFCGGSKWFLTSGGF